MILIRTYNAKAISQYLSEVGIRQDQVVFNGDETPTTNVIVRVGGQGIDYTHTYIQQHYKVPIINCLDPATVHRNPINKVYILLALDKAKRINSGELIPFNVSNDQIDIVKDISQLESFVLQLPDKFSIDIECNKQCELTCIGFGHANGALVVPFEREGANYWSDSDELKVWTLIAQILGSDKLKVFQNYIFDTMILSKLGVETCGPIVDTLIAAHLISPELPKSLADLARIYLSCEPWKGLSSWISNETLWSYNGRDAHYTLRIYDAQRESINADPQVTKLFDDLLTSLGNEVLRLCERGLTINREAIRQMTDQLTLEVDQLVADMRQKAEGLLPPKVIYKQWKAKPKADHQYVIKNAFDVYEPFSPPEGIKKLSVLQFPVFRKIVEHREFNPSSPDQVKDLIAAMGYKVPSHKGKETSDELALKKLMQKTKDPFFRLLLTHREKAKLLSTYCNIKLDPDDKLRFSINIAGTVEARFSSKQTPWGTGCNIQNIPKNFRHIVVPSQADYCIVNADFKQADPHVVAWLANEQKMLDIMDSGGDLHAYTASAIVGRDITLDHEYDRDTSSIRKIGKVVNNMLNYGGGAQRLIDAAFKDHGIIISDSDARKAIGAYFSLYPGIKRWHATTEAEVFKTRQLKTPFGRTRYFYEPLTYKTTQKALAYIPPTTVADALNIGWLNFLKEVEAEDLRVRSLMQCHDSLTFEVHRSDLDAVCKLLLHCLEGVSFPINGIQRHFEADISYGPNWGKLTTWKASSDA